MCQVSILMPVRNAGRYLEKCLDSIRAQTLTDWEALLVDDGSTDESRSIAEAYGRTDPRIHSLHNEGRGIIPALQLALAHAKGTCITRMDADDLMPENRLELMTRSLEAAPAKTMVTGLVHYFAEGPVSEGYQRYQEWLNTVNLQGAQWENVYRECVIASPNWMMRKNELLDTGGLDGLIYPEDYHLVLRWYGHGFQIRCIPQVTLYWREHPQRTSRLSHHYGQRAFFELKVGEFVRRDLRTKNLVLWGRNPKARLTRQVLKHHGITCHQMDLSDYKKLAALHNPQVLVAVYPGPEERQKLEAYLLHLHLRQGRDWWYL